MNKFFFRLDDIAPNMNWENFNRLILIFDKYNVKPLLGVIPDNQDEELLKYPNNPDFWQIIAGLINKDYSMAQHGYQHIYKTQDGGVLNISKRGELAGLDFEIQKRMIGEGKNMLTEKKLKSEIFVAPGHSFDRNTIQALKENGFKYISDGIALYPFKKWGLVWLPQILWRPRKGLFGMITVALHSNTMTEEDFAKLEKFIEKNRKKIGGFSELADWRGNTGILANFFSFIANLIFKPVWRIIFKLKHGLSG
ncbi:DUF2334 domain-containing protein [Candidatus Azambacteria bacterium]|nr:DUF2334 domain-containing protein [Candidatus Azambacteria bacterium]